MSETNSTSLVGVNTGRYLLATAFPAALVILIGLWLTKTIADDIYLTEQELVSLHALHPVYENAQRLQKYVAYIT